MTDPTHCPHCGWHGAPVNGLFDCGHPVMSEEFKDSVQKAARLIFNALSSAANGKYPVPYYSRDSGIIDGEVEGLAQAPADGRMANARRGELDRR